MLKTFKRLEEFGYIFKPTGLAVLFGHPKDGFTEFKYSIKEQKFKFRYKRKNKKLNKISEELYIDIYLGFYLQITKEKMKSILQKKKEGVSEDYLIKKQIVKDLKKLLKNNKSILRSTNYICQTTNSLVLRVDYKNHRINYKAFYAVQAVVENILFSISKSDLNNLGKPCPYPTYEITACKTIKRKLFL